MWRRIAIPAILLWVLLASVNVAAAMSRIRTFQFFDRQIELLRALDESEQVLAIAGIGGGKSHVGTARAYQLCVNNALARAWYASGTYKLLRNSWNQLYWMSKRDNTYLHAEKVHQVLYFTTTSWVAMQTAQHIDRLRGDHVDLVVLDEGSIMSEETLSYIYDRTSGRRGKILILSNVPRPRERGFKFIHDLYREWREKPPNEARVLLWPSWDNYLSYPGGENDPQILIERKRRSPDDFRRMIAADMSIRAGLVYPSFSRERHVIPGPYTPKGRIRIFGDYGMNTACILWADDDGEQLVIFKEFYRPDVISPKVAEHFVSGTLALGISPANVWDVYIDTANADLKAQVAAKGFNVERYGKVDKRDKVRLVEREERWFDQNTGDGRPKIQITSDCPHTIWECENLVVGKNGVLPAEGQPNHATDSIQYGLCGIESGQRRGGAIVSAKSVNLRGGHLQPSHGMVEI